MSININQNWNDISSSSEDSDDGNREETKIDKPQPSTTPTAPIPSRSQTTEEPVRAAEEEVRPVRERQERRKTFLSDQQLLNQYTNQTVDDPKAIKVSRCFGEDVREIIKNLKTAKVIELNESNFLLFFYKEEDLIEFLKEKIAKRYKFYFNMFERRERKEDDPKYRNKERKGSYNNRRPERRNTQDDRNDKEPSQQPQTEKEPEREEEKKQEKRKKRYSSSSADEQKISKQVKPAEPEPIKEKSQEKPEEKSVEKPVEKSEEKQGKAEEEVKPRRTTQHKFMFEIGQNSNTVVIHSDTFDTHKILEAMSRKKMMKQFSKIHIKAPFYSFSQVSILIMEIAKFNFFLDKQPPTEAESEQEFELVLVEKGDNKSDAFYDRYHKMTIEKDVHVRMLSSKFDDYFMEIDKYNLSEIVEGFEANEYIKRLKQSGPLIQKHWNTWKIEAEEDQIETLLKLTNRIKKSTVYDIDLKPSLRNEKAILTAELRERPEKERRPKVDVSNVYNYLS